jgi:hypothetical protein
MSGEHSAESLELFITNDGYLYKAVRQPIERALVLSKQAGTYTRTDALRRFDRLVSDGIARYGREIDRNAKFSAAERKSVATSLAEYFEVEHGLGNRDHLIAGTSASAHRKSPAQLDREIAQIAHPRVTRRY